MADQTKQTRWVTAIAIVGTVLAGVLGLVGAWFAFFNVDSAGFGVSVLASALAFGLLANAILRE